MTAPSAFGRELVLGIDFGTSYCTAAVYAGGRVGYALDNGDPAIPSAVYVQRDGNLVVGHEAVRRGFADPYSLVTDVKRLIGRACNDSAVRAIDASVAYKIQPGPSGNVLLKVGSVDVSPIQIVSALLSRLRMLAEQRFGGTVRRAVFSVPAVLPPAYGAELRRAAKLAGMEVVETVPEPIAGVVGIGSLRPGDRRIAVVDLGGGTFDVSLMEQNGIRFKSRGLDGDPFLGGRDFDTTLAEAIDGSLVLRQRNSLRKDVVNWQRLIVRSESVKRQLSSQPSVRLKLGEVGSLKDADLDVIVERSWIEPRWTPLVDRAVALTAAVLARTGWDPRSVDEVALIGGATLMPLVQARFSSLFGRVLTATVDSSLAVAAGSAVLAARHVSPTQAVELT